MDFRLPPDLVMWQQRIWAFVTRELQPHDAEIERTGVVAPGCLDAGRVHWGAYCVGAAQRLLDMAAARASTRRQFGRPLRAHQAIEFKIADMAASLHAARLVAYEASWRYDHAPETRQLGGALSKLIAAEVAFRIADDTMQIFGLAEARRASGARGSGDDHLVRAGSGRSDPRCRRPPP